MTPENLYYLIVAFMALGLLAYSLAISFFQARVEARAGRTGPLPPVSVILPLTGNSPLLLPGLESILAQDYPCFELILVAEDQNDPAWALVLDLAAQDSRVMPVIAGPAEACGQKNRNLLAGLEKIGPASEIVVFTDAEHLAEPDFLAELVAPIVREEAVISSGYHHFLPQEGSLAGSAKAVCVQLLNLTRTIPFLNRPWGGATAVAKKALGDLDLVSLWSVTVVDDVTLARRKGGRRRFPLRMVKPGLATPDQGETMGRMGPMADQAGRLYQAHHRGRLAGAGLYGPGTEPGLFLLPVFPVAMGGLGTGAQGRPWLPWSISPCSSGLAP